MNKLIITVSILLAGCHMMAQSQQIFESGVETGKKPWTNLKFYNDPDNFQFAIVTDRNGGNRPGIFEDAVSKINMLYPEFVLSVGDLINGYTQDTAQIKFEWEEVNQIIDELKMPFFYLPGNHDITNQVMAEEWEKRYGHRYYDFIYKNTLFIILDSNDDDDHSLTREQTDFAIESIRQHQDVRWIFVLMHHPIWNYDTGGRFQLIEAALYGRKHTILAGHTHHYYHEERNNANYYILGTTGGGSNLRGHYFGEFDHITWVTMTDEGPSLANLRLDGILPHDIANWYTQIMARAMADNATMEHVLLCNQGDKFTDGTLYLSFQNWGSQDIHVNLQFYHQHQLIIHNPVTELILDREGVQIVEIPFSSPVPIAYDEVEAIQIDWRLAYDLPEYPNFQLSGKFNLPVRPTKTSFIDPPTSTYLNSLIIGAEHQYKELKTLYTVNDQIVPEAELINGYMFRIEESSEVVVQLSNDKEQYTTAESRYYEKTTKLHEGVRVRNPKEGLKYSYYEGTWNQIPDFSKLKPVSKGVTNNFYVSDYALREDHFGMVFTGHILIQEDGMYNFRTRSDDALKLIIHDEIVLNQDDVSEFSDVGDIALRKGYHPITIQFRESIGRERIRLYIKQTYDRDWGWLDEKVKFYQ